MKDRSEDRFRPSSIRVPSGPNLVGRRSVSLAVAAAAGRINSLFDADEEIGSFPPVCFWPVEGEIHAVADAQR